MKSEALIFAFGAVCMIFVARLWKGSRLAKALLWAAALLFIVLFILSLTGRI